MLVIIGIFIYPIAYAQNGTADQEGAPTREAESESNAKAESTTKAENDATTENDARAEAAAKADNIAQSESAASAPPRPTEAVAYGTAKQNAVYNRPFIVSSQRASVGGYTEFSVNYMRTDGVTDGPSFEFRRFNLFVFSPINRSIRFLSELEFEHGTEEIRLETAQVDIEIAPELIIRGGIILPPLGAFNQQHDSPLWEFVERPLVSTTIIPATLSEVGVGANGTFFIGALDLDYQAYATQGLGDGIVDNALGRTSIPDGRNDGLLAADNNGSPAGSGRIALRKRRIAELGLSGYIGAYNTSTIDGLRIDARRAVSLAAVDYRLSLPQVEVRGEAAYAYINLPNALRSTFGEHQWGFHLDAVAPLFRFAILGYDDARLNLGARVEHVDFNAGELPSTSTPAGDSQTRLTGVVSLRPSNETVVRLSYSHTWSIDLVRSPASRAAAIQLGLATYF